MRADILHEFENILKQHITSRENPFYVEKGIIKEKIDLSNGQVRSVPTYNFLWNHEASYDESENLISTDKFVSENFPNIGKQVLDHLPNAAWVLDAGCGNSYQGFSLLKGHFHNIRYVGVDASDAVEKAYEFFQRRGIDQGVFCQADFNSELLPNDFFDLVVSIGAIHHTENMWLSLQNLASKMRRGGTMILWVYRQQEPIRRVSDEYIRRNMSELSDLEAFEMLLPLSRLGAYLQKLNIRLNIPENIPLLGIKAGQIDLQRFIHLYFVRMFYSENLSIDRNNWQNLDWFRPFYAHESTIEEIEKFCKNHGLQILQSRIVPYGAGIALTLVRTLDKGLEIAS